MSGEIYYIRETGVCFSSLCVAHGFLHRSFCPENPPASIVKQCSHLVARHWHVTWGGFSCWIYPCFLDSTASSRRAGRFGCFILKPSACDRFVCFKDSNAVSLRFSSLSSSSNILEAAIPPTRPAGRGLYPRPKSASEWCEFPRFKSRNSVTGFLCQGPKVSPWQLS